MAATQVLGTCVERRVGSSPTIPTNNLKESQMTTLVTITHDGHNNGMDVMVRSINPGSDNQISETRLLENQVFKGYVHSGVKFEVVEVPKLPAA